MRNRNFEQWFARHICAELRNVEAMWCRHARTYTSRSYHVEMAWAAWCAALGFEAVETNNDFEDVSDAGI